MKRPKDLITVVLVSQTPEVIMVDVADDVLQGLSSQDRPLCTNPSLVDRSDDIRCEVNEEVNVRREALVTMIALPTSDLCTL